VPLLSIVRPRPVQHALERREMEVSGCVPLDLGGCLILLDRDT
jgi:hypothetical protein